MSVIKIMIVSLCSTILIESFIAFFLGLRKKNDYFNVILVNLMTNPIVVSVSLFVNMRYGLRMKRIIEIFLEIGAVLIEGFFYKKYLDYKKINGYILSLVFNLFSYFLGIFINLIVW